MDDQYDDSTCRRTGSVRSEETRLEVLLQAPRADSPSGRPIDDASNNQRNHDNLILEVPSISYIARYPKKFLLFRYSYIHV